MITHLRSALPALLALLLAFSMGDAQGQAAAPSRTLTDAEWRADLAQLATLIETRHPAPFAHVERAAFDAAKQQLRADIPRLSDAQIMTRLAQLVAMIRDGHTRIAVPRAHAEFGVLQGHRGTAPPRQPGLIFADLPVRLEIFEEGVFIVGADQRHSDLIGAQVMAFDAASAEQAVEAARTTIAADNESGARLIVPDRLTMPALLHALGVIAHADRVTLRLRTEAGERSVTVAAIAPGDTIAYRHFTAPQGPPLALSRQSEKLWWTVLRNRNALFIQINELEEFPEQPLAQTLREAFSQARRQRAQRVIFDLRYNQGGTGQFNSAVIRAVLASEYNRYGSVYVLVGRQTFSAAQMLVNQFEQHTPAIFVGESTGASPSSYGDPDREVLSNSGLTLRVSRLSWHSWLAAEFRTATDPHLDAPPRAADYFAGRDAALERALTYGPPETPAEQVDALFRAGKTQGAILRFVSHVSDPSAELASAESFVERGRMLLSAGFTREGYFMMVLVSDYYPSSAAAHAGLAFALEQRGETADARRRYQRALGLDPNNREAQAGIERLGRE